VKCVVPFGTPLLIVINVPVPIPLEGVTIAHLNAKMMMVFVTNVVAVGIVVEKGSVEEKEDYLEALIHLVESSITLIAIIMKDVVTQSHNHYNLYNNQDNDCKLIASNHFDKIYDLPEDIHEVDIFDIDVSDISSMEPPVIEEEIIPDNTCIKYPKESKSDPIYIPMPYEMGEGSMMIYNNNYDVRVNIYENFRVKNIMKSKVNKPFITWHFFRERNKLNVDYLCKDAVKILEEPNAGGNSEYSETLSMDILYELYDASGIHTEMDIEYFDPNWKKCDFLCTINGENWGISVSRAMSFPNPEDFTKEDAELLLCKKLKGLIIAKQGMLVKANFLKSILHIWCETPKIAGFLIDAYTELNEDLKDDIGVMLTVLSNDEKSETPYKFDKNDKYAGLTTPSKGIFYNIGCTELIENAKN
jgi:hypothetical protein